MAKQAKRTSGKGRAKKAPANKGAAKKSPARNSAAKTAGGFQMPDWFNNVLTSPLAREAVAAALIAGAGAAAAVLAKRHGPSGKRIRSAASEASDATKEFADAAVGAFVGAASNTVRGLLPDDEGATRSSGVAPGKITRSGQGIKERTE